MIVLRTSIERMGVSSFALLLLAMTGCAPQASDSKVTRVEKLTSAERQLLQVKLRDGTALLPGENLAAGSAKEALEEECSTFLSSLPAGTKKGWVTVPEDWTDPSSPKIKVFYYVRAPKKHDPKQTPVVFFNGGPASDSHGSYRLLDDISQADSLPLVFIDQRGTGCSDLFPSEQNEETILRLSHYGTRSIVQDAEKVRSTLFGRDSRWKAFGQSYGGYIVHRYVELAPESLVAAYAHGSSLMTDPVEWLKLRIQSQHRVSQEYFSKYPEDREILAKARAAIKSDRCWTDGVTESCGPAIFDALTMMLGFHDTWDELHKWILSFYGNGKLNEANVELFVRHYVLGVFAENNMAGSVISNMDLNPGDVEGQYCSIAQKRLEAEGEKPDTWEINECRLFLATRTVVDSLLKVLKTFDPFDIRVFAEQLQAHRELKFFLYSGQRDVFVPVESFGEEVADVGTLITYRNFPESGHEGFYSERQVWKDILSVFPAPSGRQRQSASQRDGN